MNDQVIAVHAGKVQAISNMCIALVVVHKDPAEVQRIFEKLCKQAIERATATPMTEAYISGLTSIAQLLSQATGVAVASDLLNTVPSEGGH